MLVIGHRGAGGAYDENTLTAFRHAVACGADGIEFDVRLLDGQLIVLHDATLERTTDGHGHYKSLSLSALDALRTRHGEGIPRLDDVLATSRTLALVNVEVKEAGIAADVLDALRRWLAAHPGPHARLLLSSFDPATTRALAAGRGEMRLGVLYEREEGLAAALTRAVALEAWSLHLPLTDVSDTAIARVHAAGLRALVYTVNAGADLEHCLACGVDGVFSDDPEHALAVVRTPAGRAAS